MLFRIALTLFKLNEQKVMALDDSLEIFQVMQVRLLFWELKSVLTFPFFILEYAQKMHPVSDLD